AGEIWQCSWVEETGTFIVLTVDITNNKVTAAGLFSKGHWEQSDKAHGDKRIPEDLERFRELSKIGTARDGYHITSQADVVEFFTGAGELEPIEHSWPTR
ncbi:hypothetical protein NX059_007613, partial [Plenodomus lindquistii]